MSAPGLFFGAASTGWLFEANAGTTDDGTAVRMRMRSNRIAPAGLTLTATFVAVHLALFYGDAQSITVRLLVDDAVVCTKVVALPAMAPAQSHVRVPLSVPVMVDGTERVRLHPRGTWAQVEIESDGSTVAVDGVELEWDAAGRGR